ncbi:MAG TPA: hypothetical protein VFI95_04405 [Terriglobales bacterium]|nr:hypothetical protein [Terriglobales bacterium]
MAIRGTEGLSPEQINFEVQRGGKFVVYQYCVSLLVVSFRRGSGVYFVRSGESRVQRALPWIAITCLAGWWGIPWGPIWSIQSLITNFGGGKDVTAEIMARMQPANKAIGARA